MNSRRAIAFDLMTNARDSLRVAVEALALRDSGNEDARLKRAILSSAHCLELLLKERLRRVHPAFVWEDVDRYPSLDAQTVNTKTAVRRLRSVSGITLSADEEQTLESLRKTRNAIEHYEWHTSAKEARVIVGRAMSVALAFARVHLGEDIAEEFKRDDTWKMFLDELYEFVRIHGERLEKEFRENGRPVQCCDQCGQLAAPFDGGSCELCGHWQLESV